MEGVQLYVTSNPLDWILLFSLLVGFFSILMSIIFNLKILRHLEKNHRERYLSFYKINPSSLQGHWLFKTLRKWDSIQRYKFFKYKWEDNPQDDETLRSYKKTYKLSFGLAIFSFSISALLFMLEVLG